MNQFKKKYRLDNMEHELKTEPFDELFEIEKITDSRCMNSKKQYLVQWKSHLCLENSWEPEESLSFDLVNLFEESKHDNECKQLCNVSPQNESEKEDFKVPPIIKTEPETFNSDERLHKNNDEACLVNSCILCGAMITCSHPFQLDRDNIEMKMKCHRCSDELITSDVFSLSHLSNLSYVSQVFGNTNSSKKVKPKPWCDYCNKSFTTSKSLRVHLRIHTGERPFSCKICSQSFIQRSQLKRHQVIHSDERQFKCQSCGKTFRRLDQLQIHQITHSDERNFLCHVCGLGFKHKSSLTYHMFIHNERRDYICDVCAQTFKCTTDLKKHQVVHAQERVHTCINCGKAFKSKATLRSHMLTHQGVRKYRCQQCNKAFQASSNLRIHQRIHSGERPFQCFVCLKRFVQSSSLTKHKLIHTGERVPCDMCNKTFSHPSALRRHKRRLHLKIKHI